MRRGESLAWPGEAQRRDERRAEARLARGLQRLDEAERSHINTLTREQRRLHRDLLNMKAGNIWRKGFTGPGSQPFNFDPTHPTLCYNRTQLPIIPLSGKETKRHRPLKPQSGYSLQARVQEFISSGDSRADGSTAPLSLPDLKMHPGAAISSNPTTQADSDVPKTERERGKDGQRERGRERETKKEKESERDREVEVETDTDTQTLPPADPTLAPFELLAPDGRLRTVHTLPNFAQALAEARKARYLRHRGKPPSERELSIREIFSRSPSLHTLSSNWKD